MGYERYPRDTNPQGDYYNRTDPQDYGRDYGSGRHGSYSSARDYQAVGETDERQRGYGQREYGNQRYGQREQMNQGRDYYGGRSYGSDRDDRSRNAARGARDYGYGGGARDNDRNADYHGSYASDGRRFEDVGRYRNVDDDDRDDRGRGRGGYGRQPQGYDYEERGFMARAGDEVRSWFGDDDAERRREMDSRYDERQSRPGSDRHPTDDHYHSWRSEQMAALDRDYDEYRNENRSKFHNEFSAWRSERQGQRDLLGKVDEHMDVVGSDDEHVGTVDKVRGDRILLTKNDADAGGRHHSIPSRWIKSVDGKVTLTKSASEAKSAWKDEERNQAMFGDETADRQRNTGSSTAAAAGTGTGTAGQETDLNRSFSGTYKS